MTACWQQRLRLDRQSMFANCSQGRAAMLNWLLRKFHVSDTDRRIRKHGWTAIYVGDYSTAPTWVYTVGFDETLNQPEVIVFDVTQEIANQLLWMVFEELRSGSLVLK